MQSDIELLDKRVRELKDEMVDKDGQIKVISMNLNNCEKQRAHLNSEVLKFEKFFYSYQENNQIFL